MNTIKKMLEKNYQTVEMLKVELPMKDVNGNTLYAYIYNEGKKVKLHDNGYCKGLFQNLKKYKELVDELKTKYSIEAKDEVLIIKSKSEKEIDLNRAIQDMNAVMLIASYTSHFNKTSIVDDGIHLIDARPVIRALDKQED